MATLQAIRAQLQATRAQLTNHRPRPRNGALQGLERPLSIPKAECPAPGTERLRMLPPQDLKIDPARFQFRCSPGADGTTGRLEGCPCFRLELAGALLAWVDPADGSGPWLVDGHHRRALAVADGAAAVAVLLVDAPTDQEARAMGALSNVAAGHANAVDLARLLRDQGRDPRTLARTFGLQRNNRCVTDARELLALDPDLFGRCCTGQLALDQALALAAASDHALQRRLAAMASQRGWDPAQTTEAVALAQLVPTRHEVPEGVLPGLEGLMSEANPLLDQMLQLRAIIRRSLRIEHRTAGVVGHHRAAAAMERRGVVPSVDLEQAQAVRAEAGALLDAFGRLAGCSGPLAALIAQLAAQVADGADPVRLVDQHIGQIREILAAELS